MAISSQLLFFFSALGAFNGILLTLYLWLSKPVNTQRRLLGALMLVISLRVSKSIWFYFDPNLGKQFLQLGLSACFLIGPLLLFYVASSTGRLESLRLKWTWHLGLLLATVAGLGILFPYQSNTELWGIFYRVINLVWGVYIVLAGLLLIPQIYENHKNGGQLSKDGMLSLNVFVGTMLIWLAYFTASYTSYIVGALSFSFVLYISALTWILANKGKQQKAKPYADKKIAKPLETELAERLFQLMSNEHYYKNPNLTLPFLAKKMRVSVPQLSQFLNDNLQKSFANYVNEWRIQEARRLLIDTPNMTMELVAESSGYNSQSTFYAAFKQFENTTPAKFRKAQQTPL